jgi:hypothetical protein
MFNKSEILTIDALYLPESPKLKPQRPGSPGSAELKDTGGVYKTNICL